MSGTVYVLRCANDKYYVGWTTNLPSRYDSHCTGTGADWTRLHKPIEILERFADSSQEFELTTTLRWMREKGISNVRGGPWVKRKLSASDIDFIERMNSHIENRCFKCKGAHYASECKVAEVRQNLLPTNTSEPSFWDWIIGALVTCSGSRKCTRCGRDSHSVERCYATKHADGYLI
jgi:predicted GIY-YIG superfamily endonuclease